MVFEISYNNYDQIKAEEFNECTIQYINTKHEKSPDHL